VAKEPSGGIGSLPVLGSVFGRYRLDSVMGRGGMGVVFLATDLELERPVALKLLSPDLAPDSAFQTQFVRESRLAAAIEHPNIVPIYDSGTISGLLFIAMRYVPGTDLAAQLRLEGNLPVVRSLTIAGQLADALDAAHSRGLVHRDVKPANVLLDATDGRAVLVDFGLTHRHGQTGAWTKSGLFGSVDYMAPEQIERRAIDGRTDQYSLACVLFHMLSGSTPFEGSDTQVLFAHVHAPRPSLSERRPDLRNELDPVLARAMALDPVERFENCRDLVIAGWRASAPIAAVEPPSQATSVVELHGPDPDEVRPDPAALPGRVGDRRRSRSAATVVAVLVAALALPGGWLIASNLGDSGSSPSPGAAATSGGTLQPDEPQEAVLTPPPGAREVILFASNRDGDFDLYRLDPADPEPVRFMRDTARDEMGPALSPDGRMVAFSVGRLGARDIVVMNVDGSNRQLVADGARDEWGPAWSTDGTRLAYMVLVEGSNIDVHLLESATRDFASTRHRDLTGRPATEQYPAWSKDGRILMSTNYWGGNRDLVTIDPDRPGTLRLRDRLTDGLSYDILPTYTPAGDAIVFSRGPDNDDTDLYWMRSDGTRVRSLTAGERVDLFPDVSPNGSHIVYAGGPSDEAELWTATINGRDQRPLTRDFAHSLSPDWWYMVDGAIAQESILPTP
jgi:serine/threonine-protein kinase